MESVGNKLKNLRLQKGLSLEEVNKKTKIHLNILKAIEEDSLVNFSPVYIKGFLKIYCKFLGVDPRECIPDYKEASGPASRLPDLQEKPVFGSKIASLKSFSLKVIREKMKIIIIFMATAIFAFCIFNLGKFISSRIKRLKSLPAAASREAKEKIPAAKSQNLPVRKIITLDMHARENCFVQVKSDGRVIFQNILKKGRSETWQAKDKIELSLGNAGAVELEVNGRRISALGRKGQVLKNILITKEGLSVKR